MNFVAGLRPYIYDDDRLQELKSKKFRVRIELSLFTTSSEITFIQFYSSRHGKDPTKKPKLLLKFTSETFLGIDPRIVPNNFSTNINVRGKFNLNHSYACGMSSIVPHKNTMSSVLYTLPQRPHNSTYLVCEIPAIRSNLKVCSRNDDQDNWNRCYSDYALYVLREINVGVNPNAREDGSVSFVPLSYSGNKNKRIIQVTDYRNIEHFQRSDAEWNSQSERTGGYHAWNGPLHYYFGKEYDPNDFGIYRTGDKWNPNWENDYYYRDPNIYSRYHGTGKKIKNQ
eukprot:g6663.t1